MMICRLDRYITDPLFASQTGIDSTRYIDAYDILLCDDKHKLKVLLSPNLNFLIQQGQIAVGHLIKLNNCSLKFDESDLNGNSIVIVHEVEVTGENLDDLAVKLLLPWSPECNEKEKQPLPLASARGYYVNLWSSVETSGLIWKTSDDLEDATDYLKFGSLVGIKDVSKQWKHYKGSQPYLLVKVMLKSRLMHYAKPNKCDKWPYQMHLTVGDETGVCTAVLWNALCPHYYHRIKEGSLLLIRNYTVKKSYSLATTSNPIVKSCQQYDIDINLNAHHPVAEIHLLDPSTVPDDVKGTLIKQEYNFIDRKQLCSIPENYICDVVGVVTYISHNQRELMNCKSGIDSGGYWIKTWIGVLDGTSQKPLFIQFYNCSPDLLQQLEPGQILMIRHVRVIHNLVMLDNSKQQKYVFVTSTKESQAVKIESDSLPIELGGEESVKRLIEWCKSEACKKAASSACIGGHFTYPPLPNCLQTLRNNHLDLKVILSQDWEKEIENVALKESRRIFIQAYLVSIQYIPSERENREFKSRKSKADSTDYTPLQLSKMLNANRLPPPDSYSPLGNRFDDVSIYTAPIPHNKLKCGSTEILGMPWNSEDQLYQNLNELENWKDSCGWSLLWQGLNFPNPLLHSALTSQQEVTDQTSLLELLSGQCEKDVFTSDNTHMTEEQLNHIFNTADEVSNHRFLVVLDLYRFHKHIVCVNVSRAFSLGI